MISFSKRFCCFLTMTVAVFLVVASADEEDEIFTSDNKMDCVNKMVDWCDNMKYPKEGAGLSMVSIAVTDSSGKFWRIFCASDSDGTNCTRNVSPWFSCSNDNKLTYNGVTLQKDTIDGVDDDICNTTKTAFDDIFIQNLSYNPINITTELNNGLKSLFDVMADLEEKFDIMRDKMSKSCFPFCDKSAFDNFFPFGDNGYATELPEPNNGSNQDNQLERE